MTNSVVPRSVGNTPRVRRGTPIRARYQNDTQRALLAVQYLQNTLKTASPRTWAETMLHQITAIRQDYLECVRVWRGATLGSETVFVAKPRLLRGSLTSRNGVTYVYTDLTEWQRRTASKSGETDEAQIVTPDYLVGDVIEVHVVRGVTGITEVDNQRGSPIDKNVDGRAWGTVPP